MANTTTTTLSRGIMTLTFAGNGADWNSNTDAGFPLVKIKSIQFVPSNASDIMIVRDGGNDGPAIFDGTNERVKQFNGFFKPYIDISDCTLNTPANASVIFEIG